MRKLSIVKQKELETLEFEQTLYEVNVWLLILILNKTVSFY